VTQVDNAAWQTELRLHEGLFQQLAYHLPPQITATKERIAARLEG
jgi:phosphoenolpyruvate carboxykinase (GTP)